MTDCVRAVSIGCAVPRADFKAVVHSVFRSTVNLQAAGEGPLLTVLPSEASDLPQGIRLDARELPALEGLVTGAPAVCRKGTLTIGERLSIELGNARIWPCDLSSLNAELTDSEVCAAWQQAWQLLRTWRSGRRYPAVPATSRAGDPTYRAALTQRMDAAARRLLAATAEYDLTGLSVIGDLIGLGIGLTPAGDDLLTGYLAGLRCTRRQQEKREAYLAVLSELVIRYSTLTNDISRTYLCLAARGQVSSRLLDLAAAICKGADSARIVNSAEAAMRVGHSSGMDAVNGLLLGLAAWDGPGLLTLEPGTLVS